MVVEIDREILENIITVCEGKFKALEKAIDKIYNQCASTTTSEKFIQELTDEQLIEFLKLIKY